MTGGERRCRLLCACMHSQRPGAATPSKRDMGCSMHSHRPSDGQSAVKCAAGYCASAYIHFVPAQWVSSPNPDADQMPRCNTRPHWRLHTLPHTLQDVNAISYRRHNFHTFPSFAFLHQCHPAAAGIQPPHPRIALQLYERPLYLPFSFLALWRKRTGMDRQGVICHSTWQRSSCASHTRILSRATAQLSKRSSRSRVVGARRQALNTSCSCVLV
ncbi:hypothetical protein BU26DRAFT_135729 [Trematosphaeria pertusa]|uniref:Uncharacterized protein n=1 Tax=Trematosphaeria pertusa TaxID=390896 RepID=A0A6A6IV27_9PLEO|nr:uncharacterized protein BU26DRAFT_135729 [Trematosphaeria pertusa]KAF2254279.1 hypothetical protein BU26DRAFT_135729 [Trematosphaeria pertusa]